MNRLQAWMGQWTRMMSESSLCPLVLLVSVLTSFSGMVSPCGGMMDIPSGQPFPNNEHVHFPIVPPTSLRMIHIKNIWKVWLTFEAKLNNFKERINRCFPKENGVVLRRMASGCQSGINNRCPLHAPVSLTQDIPVQSTEVLSLEEPFCICFQKWFLIAKYTMIFF